MAEVQYDLASWQEKSDWWHYKSRQDMAMADEQRALLLGKAWEPEKFQLENGATVPLLDPTRSENKNLAVSMMLYLQERAKWACEMSKYCQTRVADDNTLAMWETERADRLGLFMDSLPEDMRPDAEEPSVEYQESEERA